MSTPSFLALPSSHQGRDEELVVIDIGYSSESPTCGLYCGGSGEEVMFGKAIELTFSFLQSIVTPIVVVEGVLSVFHQENGNPAVRGAFEKGRGWYYGSGATIHAASLRFIQQLHTRLVESTINKTVFLAEAFLSNKTEKTTHVDDAAVIAQDFWSTPIEDVEADCEPVTTCIAGVPPVRAFKGRCYASHSE